LEPIAAVASFGYEHQKSGRLAAQAAPPLAVAWEEQLSMVVEGE
jgi:hypothetical protein